MHAAPAKHLYAIQATTGEGFFKLWDDWLTLAVTAFCRDDTAYMAVMNCYGQRLTGREHPAASRNPSHSRSTAKVVSDSIFEVTTEAAASRSNIPIHDQ